MQQSGTWEVTFVCVEDALVASCLPRIKPKLTRVLERNGDVILDLRGTQLDSAGLGAVLALQRQLELRERRLLVITRGAGLLSLLDAAGASGALSLFTDIEQALAQTRGRSERPIAA